MAEDQANVERLKRNIANTVENIVHANDIIAFTGDKKMKQVLSAKNEQRQKALDQMLRQVDQGGPGKSF